MPKYPVYVALLPEEAQAALGQPHDAGVAAQRLLAAEGFGFHGYVDIFDGGPTMDVAVGEIRTVREAEPARVSGPLSGGGTVRLVGGGRLKAFRCAAGPVAQAGDGALLVGPEAPFAVGDEVLHVGF
jgi:arginine N-succinyltransferase